MVRLVFLLFPLLIILLILIYITIQRKNKNYTSFTDQLARSHLEQKLNSVTIPETFETNSVGQLKEIDDISINSLSDNTVLKKRDNEIEINLEYQESISLESNNKKAISSISPIKRGGRSRTLKDQSVKSLEKPNLNPSIFKPELICWDEDNCWMIGIELPIDFNNGENTSFFQGSYQLQPINSNKNWFPIINFFTPITWNNGYNELTWNLEEQKYLVFKIRKNWQSPGRLVAYPSNGYYLIVAPDRWTRDEEKSDIAPINSELTAIDGFRVHFFVINKDNKVCFFTPEGEEVNIKTKVNQFYLSGKEIADDNEGMGPLYCQNLPRLYANKEDWDYVSSIIIGNEGKTAERWRLELKPNGKSELDLPEEMEFRNGGWYFLRIYNHQDQLIDSLDFRYCKALRDIQIPGFSPPNKHGYQAEHVEFLHDPGCKIKPCKNKEIFITIHEGPEKTVFEIPSISLYDYTDWEIIFGKTKVIVTIQTNRIWWVEGEIKHYPEEDDWQAGILILYPEDFYATSKKLIWLKFPKNQEIRKVLIGLEEASGRSYYIPVEEGIVKVPLRDFTDCENWRLFSGIKDFNLWVQYKEKTIIKLAEVSPAFECKWCGWVTSIVNDLHSHISNNHLNELYQPLNYQEIQKYIPDLPRYIYKCGYCGYYAKSNDTINPTSKICQHVERECKKAPEGDKKNVGFMVITSLDEIRESIKRTLPDMFYCKLCIPQEVIQENNGEKKRDEHILIKHKREIEELCRKRR